MLALFLLFVVVFSALLPGDGKLRTVVITSKPADAAVLIDGKARKTTAKGEYQLAVGKHTLKLSKTGYEDYSTEIQIAAGTDKQKLDLIVLQQPNPIVLPKVEEKKNEAEPSSKQRMVSIRSNPTGAKVEIDGILQELLTGTRAFALQPGKRRVRLTKDGWRPYETEIVVTPGEDQLPPTVMELTAILVIDVLPSSLKLNITQNSLGMQMVLIPAGKFRMGASSEDADAQSDEQPMHDVILTNKFRISSHEVTISQFKKYVESDSPLLQSDEAGGTGYDTERREFKTSREYNWNHSGWPISESHPVVNVSWNDAIAFCRWLSQKEQKKYSLPTEAQWEYACRAGVSSGFASGNNPESLAAIANVADARLTELFSSAPAIKANDGFDFTAPVGSFGVAGRNAFGLFDMHGNVAEWCYDSYSPAFYTATTPRDPVNTEDTGERVIRGGGWYLNPGLARTTARYASGPKFLASWLGFRVISDEAE